MTYSIQEIENQIQDVTKKIESDPFRKSCIISMTLSLRIMELGVLRKLLILKKEIQEAENYLGVS